MDKTKREPHQSGGLFLWRVAGKHLASNYLPSFSVDFSCVGALNRASLRFVRWVCLHAQYTCQIQIRAAQVWTFLFEKAWAWTTFPYKDDLGSRPIQYRPKAQRSRSAKILRDLPVAVPGPLEAPTAGHDWTGRRRRNSQTNTRATTEISNPARAPVAVTVRWSWALGIRRPSHATPRHSASSQLHPLVCRLPSPHQKNKQGSADSRIKRREVT